MVGSAHPPRDTPGELNKPMARLLVIDDDDLILDSFQLGFDEPDYEVLTARSASEGLTRFAECDPDVALLDIRLPDMSGLDAFRQLHELSPKTPIILMTGHGSAATAIEAMRLGAYEYIVKPFERRRDRRGHR